MLQARTECTLALRNPNLQNALSESRLAKVSKLIQEVMRRISLGDSRVSIAFKDNLKACKARGRGIVDHGGQDFLSERNR